MSLGYVADIGPVEEVDVVANLPVPLFILGYFDETREELAVPRSMRRVLWNETSEVVRKYNWQETWSVLPEYPGWSNGSGVETVLPVSS